MIPFRINIDYDLDGLFASVRDRREVLRAAFQDGGVKWHQEYLPRHFRPSAAQRYGYRPRSDAYLKRKRRDAARGKAVEGGNTPLVYTGLLKRAVTGFAAVRGFPSRFRVTMNTPSYIPERTRTTTQPPIAQEMTRFTRTELDSMANYIASRITYHNNRVRRRRRVTIA